MIQQRKTNGFTLIEILISTVVISIGLLGTAGLQIKALRGTHNSQLRSQALILANNMVERIHANSLAAQNVDSTLDNSYAAIDSTNIDCTDVPDPYCSNYYDGSANVGGDCNFNQMAVFDAFVWVCGIETAGTQYGGVKNTLPEATATVTCNDIVTTDADACTNGSSHSIVVSWTENKLEMDANSQEETQIQSVTLLVTP